MFCCWLVEIRASSNPDRHEGGGERGIRTLDGLLTHTPLAGARLRPLGHLSGARSAYQFPLSRCCGERGIIPRIHALTPVGAVRLIALPINQTFKIAPSEFSRPLGPSPSLHGRGTRQQRGVRRAIKRQSRTTSRPRKAGKNTGGSRVRKDLLEGEWWCSRGSGACASPRGCSIDVIFS